MSKILWADDQIDVARTLSHHIESLGCDVVFVESGGEALHELRTGSFELCILDLQMPPGIWGGLAVLQELHDTRLEVAVLALSGAGSQLETIKALRLGALDYVMKECAAADLRLRVEAALLRARPMRATLDLIRDGESKTVEFKETLRWNTRDKKIDKRMEHSCLKTIAAFLNSAGGTLLIGVKDSGEVGGLDADNFFDKDSLLLHLDTIVNNGLGIAALSYIRASFESVMGRTVLRIDCRPSPEAIFLRSLISGEDREFYVRRTASSAKLRIDEALDYVKVRFGDQSIRLQR